MAACSSADRQKGSVMHILFRLIRSDSGASAAEYALILAVIGIGVVIAAVALGTSIGNSMQCTADTINAGTTVAGC